MMEVDIRQQPFALSVCAVSLYWVHIGLGQHMKKVLTNGIATSVSLNEPYFAISLLYNSGITLVKLSAVLFYARVFRTVRMFTLALWGTGTLVIAWWVTYCLLAIFTCIPVQKQWDEKIPGHCLSSQNTFVAAASPNIAIDAIILLLPMPMLWKLQVRRSQKFGLFAVFALGYW